MEDVNKMFPHIAGYEAIKEECAQAVDILNNTEEYTKNGAHVPRGWLFYGPSGVGKTRIIKDMADYLKIPVIEISISDAINNDITIDEDIVAGFKKAKEAGKCILFIDELDKIAGFDNEYPAEENLKSQKVFLRELDKVKEYDGIAIFATANERDYLAASILRSGRFDRQVKFSLPGRNDRIKILSLFIGNAKISADISVPEMADRTANCSGADLETIINEAKISAIAQRSEYISLKDFESAYNRITSNDIPKKNEEENEKLKMLAYHEAGHAFMSYLCSANKLTSITLLKQGDARASVNRILSDSSVHTKSDYIREIMVTFAGMIGTYVMTGDYTDGNCSDLEHIKELASAMADENFLGINNIILHPKLTARVSPKNYDCWHSKIMKLLNGLYRKTKKVLSKNKTTLENIAVSLLDNMTLSGNEVIEIIEKDKSTKRLKHVF